MMVSLIAWGPLAGGVAEIYCRLFYETQSPSGKKQEYRRKCCHKALNLYYKSSNEPRRFHPIFIEFGDLEEESLPKKTMPSYHS